MQTLARGWLSALVGLAALVAACGSKSSAPSSNAQLASLAVSAGTLTPAFSATVQQYGLAVPHGTASVVVSPTAADPAARSITVSQDGGAATTVPSGAASAALPVPAVGATSQIVVLVTAQDGTTQLSYAIALTQEAAPASSDATLSALSVSAGSLAPGFSPSVTTYAVSVPNGTSSFTVTPQADSSAATITVAQDGGAAAAVASGSTSAALSVPAIGASSSVAIVVTAQDRVTQVTYLLTATQGLSGDATLSSLTVSDGALSPAFAAGITSYAVTVPNGTASFTVTPEADSSAATSIEVSQDGGSPVLVSSGSASAPLLVPAPFAISTISIVITAQDGTTHATYQIALSQAPSSDSALSSLAVSAGALSPAFSSGVLAYALVVPNGTASITVTPQAHGSDAMSITVAQDGGAPATVESGSASPALSIPAAGVTSTISIVVTAQDGSTSTTYQVALTQAPSSDATLASLAVSAGSLSPAFSSSTTSYSLAAPNGTSTITITPTLHNSSASSITLAINGGTPVALSSGNASAAIAVPVSGVTTTLVIVVTAQDGSTTDTYQVALTQAPSSDATLSSLAVSAGTLSPVFAAATTSYSVVAPNGTASITVTPTAHASKITSITVSYNGGAAVAVTSGSPTSALSVPAVGGSATLAFVVTAQDGTTKDTYSIALMQAPSTDATLSALTFSAGTLSPVFAAATTSYSLVVPNGTASFTVTPTAHSSKITSITVSNNGGAPVAVTSGSASSALTAPAVGSPATLALVVTAQDGTTADTYSIAVAQAPLTDATLASLAVSAGALSPIFAAGTFTYSLSLPNGTSSLTVTPTAHATAIASITVKQDSGDPVTVASGSASPALSVPAPGSPSTITVQVTAQDNTTKDSYTIAVTQQPLVSTDATLGDLTVSAGTLSPAFASGTTSYSLSVAYGTTSLSVTPTAHATAISSIQITQDSGAPQTVASGSASAALTIPAPGTPSTVTILVTAQDGSTTASYTISLTQAAPDHDATLSGLAASAGSLSPAFAAGTTSYSLALPNGTAALQLTATENDPLALSIVLTQDSATPIALTSGQPSPSLAVPAVGTPSNVSIAVTAQDGTTQVNYAIAITQQASTSSVWFEDNFESGSLSNWTLTPGGGTTPGAFSIATDPGNASNHVMQYVAGSTSAPASPASTNGAGWVIAMLSSAVQSALPSQSNYYLEARIRPYANSTTGNKQLYMVGRYQDVTDLYGAGLNVQSAITSTKMEFSRELAGALTKLISVSEPIAIGTWSGASNTPPANNDGAWYGVRADFNGTQLTLYLNGTVIGTTTDSNFSSGPIGLYTANKSFLLDDFKVGDPSVAPAQLSLSPSALTWGAGLNPVGVGSTYQVTVTAVQSDGVTPDTFTVSSNAPGVVSVSVSGNTVTLTAVADGTAYISFIDGSDPDIIPTLVATITN